MISVLRVQIFNLWEQKTSKDCAAHGALSTYVLYCCCYPINHINKYYYHWIFNKLRTYHNYFLSNYQVLSHLPNRGKLCSLCKGILKKNRVLWSWLVHFNFGNIRRCWKFPICIVLRTPIDILADGALSYFLRKLWRLDF